MLYAGNGETWMAKGGCYICGRSDRLVDADCPIEGEGGLVICTVCITELARTGKMVVNDQAEIAALEARIEYLEDEKNGAVQETAELRERFETLQREWVAAVETADR